MKVLKQLRSTLDFSKELENIDANTSTEQKRLIHFKSLRNFIFYYDNFRKEKNTRERMLREYFEVIEGQNYSFSEEQSKAAFDMYIFPISDIYRKHINFSAKLNVIAVILYFSLPNILLWVIFHSKVLSFSFLPLISLYWINYLLKFPRKKIYGYKY